MKENPEMKWHQNPTIIILMLIIFFPVGIYFMWKNEMLIIKRFMASSKNIYKSAGTTGTIKAIKNLPAESM